MKKILLYTLALLIAVFCVITAKALHDLRVHDESVLVHLSRMGQNVEYVVEHAIDAPAEALSMAQFNKRNADILSRELFAHRDLTMQGFKDMETAFKKQQAEIETLKQYVEETN